MEPPVQNPDVLEELIQQSQDQTYPTILDLVVVEVVKITPLDLVDSGAAVSRMVVAGGQASHHNLVEIRWSGGHPGGANGGSPGGGGGGDGGLLLAGSDGGGGWWWCRWCWCFKCKIGLGGPRWWLSGVSVVLVLIFQ